jgi:hypothetical protein
MTVQHHGFFLFNKLVSGVIFFIYFLLAFGLGADLSDTLMDRMVKHEKYLFLKIELNEGEGSS